jgi:predicted DNA-binding transcriptional regulator YafY
LLLKEDRQMWYIIGLIDGKQSPTTFALDRITSLVVTNEEFSLVEFDSDAYFQHSFGITVLDEAPIKVTLSFTAEQGDYLRTLKIHETQEVIEDNDKEFKITVWVKPTYEFYSKILSYGADVKVVSPKRIVETVQMHLESAIKRYIKKVK